MKESNVAEWATVGKSTTFPEQTTTLESIRKNGVSHTLKKKHKV